MKRIRLLADSLLIHFALVELALLTAFFLRFDFVLPTPMKWTLLWAVPVAIRRGLQFHAPVGPGPQ